MRDLRQIRSAAVRAHIGRALDDLGRDPRPENLDIQPLRGRSPWRRLRVGDYRLIFRPMTLSELHRAWARGIAADKGILVVRIVPRQDFDRAVSRLK